MKSDKIKCPSCGKPAHLVQIEKATLFSDDFYDMMKSEFKEGVLLSSVCDNVIYKCICESCDNYFGAMAVLDVDVKDVVIGNDYGDLMSLHAKDYSGNNGLISAEEARNLSGVRSKEEETKAKIAEINTCIKEAIKCKKRTAIIGSGVATNGIDAPYEILGSDVVEQLEKARYKISAQFLKLNENDENVFEVYIQF